MKKKFNNQSGFIEVIIIIIVITIIVLGYKFYFDKQKKKSIKALGEITTNIILLAQHENYDINGVYYYNTSGGCNSKTTQEIINNLPYDKELGEHLNENFYYCISGDSNSNTFKITAKSVSTNCEIHRDKYNFISYNDC